MLEVVYKIVLSLESPAQLNPRSDQVSSLAAGRLICNLLFFSNTSLLQLGY